jgi:hypothetical protein
MIDNERSLPSVIVIALIVSAAYDRKKDATDEPVGCGTGNEAI